MLPPSRTLIQWSNLPHFSHHSFSPVITINSELLGVCRGGNRVMSRSWRLLRHHQLFGFQNHNKIILGNSCDLLAEQIPNKRRHQLHFSDMENFKVSGDYQRQIWIVHKQFPINGLLFLWKFYPSQLLGFIPFELNPDCTLKIVY